MDEKNWQPIETAPQDGKVLITGYDGSMCVAHRCSSGQGWLAGPTESWVGNNFVSHWMTLPAPPRSES